MDVEVVMTVTFVVEVVVMGAPIIVEMSSTVGL